MNIRAGFFRHAVRASVLVLTTFLCYAPICNSSAQSSITGEWILEFKSGTDLIYFSIHRRSEGGGRMSSSSDIKAEVLRGLSASQTSGSGAPVSFQVVRDAGTLNCEGWFKDGKGSGSFTFAPN